MCLAPTSRKIIKALFKSMQGSTAFGKKIIWKSENFRDIYMPFYEFKSSKPQDVISDSESVQSEAISTDKTDPKSQDFSQLYTCPSFATFMQEQIATALAKQLTVIASGKPAEVISDPRTVSSSVADKPTQGEACNLTVGSPMVFHSSITGLESSSVQGEARNLAGNTIVSHSSILAATTSSFISPSSLRLCTSILPREGIFYLIWVALINLTLPHTTLTFS